MIRAVQTCANATDFPFDIGNALLNLIPNALHLLLHFAQLFQIHLPLNIALHVIDISLGSTQQSTNGPRSDRQSLGADHHEGDKPNQN